MLLKTISPAFVKPIALYWSVIFKVENTLDVSHFKLDVILRPRGKYNWVHNGSPAYSMYRVRYFHNGEIDMIFSRILSISNHVSESPGQDTENLKFQASLSGSFFLIPPEWVRPCKGHHAPSPRASVHRNNP